MADIFAGNENETSSTQGFLGFATRVGVSEATTERMRITAAGNAGIGTSTPSYRLDVANADGTALARFKDTDSAYNGVIIAGDTSGGWVGNNATITGEGIYYHNSTNSMRMSTNSSERMRIDSAGNVGIGTSSPSNKLEVNGTGYFTDNVAIVRTNTAGSLSGLTITNAGTSSSYAGVNLNSGTVSSQFFNDAAAMLLWQVQSYAPQATTHSSSARTTQNACASPIRVTLVLVQPLLVVS